MKQESATETYLRRATRGLWGRKRWEVREELEAHLLERTLAHRIAGLAEADAVERALSELGRPQEVSVGMTRLYTLPTVVGSGTVLAAVCVLVVALLPKGAAQSPVIGSFYWPSVECTAALRTDSILGAYNACRELDNSLWLDPQAFAETLEAQGVTVGRNDETLTLTFPNTPPIRVPLGAPAITLDGTFVYLGETSDLSEAALKGEEIPAVPGALSLWNLLKAVSEQSELSIRFEGEDNPVAHLGNISFQVGTKLRPVDGLEFYDSYLENVFFSDLIGSIENVYSTFLLNPRVDIGTPLEETVLEVSATPGTYGVVTLLDPKTLEDFLANTVGDPGAIALYASFEVVEFEGGTLTANLPEQSVRFVEAFTAEPEFGTAVLVRLSGKAGKGWYEVVSPDEVTLEPTP